MTHYLHKLRSLKRPLPNFPQIFAYKALQQHLKLEKHWWREAKDFSCELTPSTAPLFALTYLAGIAQTPASGPADPRAWFAAFRYGIDFPGYISELRPYDGVEDWDPRLRGVLAEEISIGVAMEVAFQQWGYTHFCDLPTGEAIGLVRRRQRSGRTCDFVLIDDLNRIALLEVKGSIGTRCSITTALSDGVSQIEAVDILQNPHPDHKGLVIGTHLCVENRHTESRTTSIVAVVRHPPQAAVRSAAPRRPPEQPAEASIRATIASGYLKALKFAQAAAPTDEPGEPRDGERAMLEVAVDARGPDTPSTVAALSGLLKKIEPREGIEDATRRAMAEPYELGTNDLGVRVQMIAPVADALSDPTWTLDQLGKALRGDEVAATLSRQRARRLDAMSLPEDPEEPTSWSDPWLLPNGLLLSPAAEEEP